MAARTPFPPRSVRPLLAAATLVALAAPAHADYALRAWTLADGGAAQAKAGAYALDFAVGQPVAHTVTNGAYRLDAGFWHAVGSAVLGAPALGDDAPRVVTLYVPAPNPSLESAAIRYDLPSASPVRLEILDVNGRRVRGLESGSMGAGRHVVLWNGLTDDGHAVAPGIYLLRLDAGAVRQTRRLVRLH